jgi:hypothetical protein
MAHHPRRQLNVADAWSRRANQQTLSPATGIAAAHHIGLNRPVLSTASGIISGERFRARPFYFTKWVGGD